MADVHSCRITNGSSNRTSLAVLLATFLPFTAGFLLSMIAVAAPPGSGASGPAKDKKFYIAQPAAVTPCDSLVVDAGVDLRACENGVSFQVGGSSPFGGTWSGRGVNANGVFSPVTAGVGTHVLTYTYALATCSRSDTRIVTVEALPAKPVITVTGKTVLCPGESVTLTAPAGYATYRWSNLATTQSITVTGGGNYTVVVRETRTGCNSPTSNPVAITSTSNAVFAGYAETFCVNEAPKQFTGATPAGGTWSGPGISATGLFNPLEAGPGVHLPTYTVSVNGCTVSGKRQVTVLSTPTVRPDLTVCITDVFVKLTDFSPTGGTWSGKGVRAGDVFDPMEAGVGTHTLTYTAGGCPNVATQKITVTDGSRVYVKAGAQGANNGTSWQDAYPDLQTALKSGACVTEIWVAAGTYKPTPYSDRNATFALNKRLRLLGGFNGTETSPNQRDWKKNTTTLTGLLGSERSYHVVTTTGLDTAAVIDGFTITGGNADYYSQYLSNNSFGGGIYVLSGGVTVRNCLFTANHATCGGGISTNLGVSRISNCTFTGNSAYSLGAGYYAYIAGGGWITDCLFENNVSQHMAGAASVSGRTVLSNCVFRNNRSTHHAGAVLIENSSSESPTITHCQFVGNRTETEGGALLVQQNVAPVIAYSTFQNNATNSFYAYGGGICTYGKPLITGCSFYGNRTGGGSGSGIANQGGNARVVNCLFSLNDTQELYNSAGVLQLTNSTVYGPPAVNWYEAFQNDGTGTSIITNCILWRTSQYKTTITREGGSVSVRNSIVYGGYPGTGNLDADPLFVKMAGPDNVAGNGDDVLELQPTSPALNAGIADTTGLNLPPTDFTGKPRLIGVRLDMGAVESWAGQWAANPARNVITGRIFVDANANARPDAGEKGLPYIVKAEPGAYYALADSAGNYSLPVDTGTYQVSQVIPLLPGLNIRPLYPVNPPAHTASFRAAGGVDSTNHFANQVDNCPYLTVEVVSDRRRRCASNRTVVTYRNEGNAPAEGVTVKVSFPENVVPLHSTHAWTGQEGSTTYLFPVGTLAAGQTGSFVIRDSVRCLPGIAGLTLCTSARIVALANPCAPASEGTVKSEVTLLGKCLGNQVQFRIANAGTADMLTPAHYRLFADHVLLETAPFALKAGDTLTVQVDAQGKTIRLEADQENGYAGNGRRQVTVEACGQDAGGRVSQGLVTQMPQEESPDRDVHCLPIVDSFDPNDKSVQPEGITAHRYTPSRTRLEYLVRFQNTGTAPAERVVVVDTLSEHVDVATLKMGATSHPCTWKVSGKGRPVITWTFNAINLPDSTDDEPNSHGFIRYTVQPLATAPQGTEIRNWADIYFDYNAPVRTNTTSNVLRDTVLTGQPLSLRVDRCTSPGKRLEAVNRTVCDQDTAVLGIPATFSGLGQWTVVSGPAVVDQPNNPATGVHDLSPGTHVFEWADVNCLLEPVRVRITITRKARPDTPEIRPAGTDSLLCSVPGTAYQWYLDEVLLADNTQRIRIAGPGVYTVVITEEACRSLSSKPYTVSPQGVVSATENNVPAGVNVRVIPNPARETFAVEVHQWNRTRAGMTLHNALGKEIPCAQTVSSYPDKLRVVFNNPHLKPGVYFLRVKLDNNTVVKKVIIE